MNIFSVISILGGLSMFLFGMRMMGDGLKESSSGTLKTAMEKLTSTPVKAFLTGLVMTALIQSSTATIVITSGLVGAGIIPLGQSLGIIIGANVGTTVTGQIIRLLDLNSSGTSFLQFLKPSTLAPLAMIVGIILIMGKKFRGSEKVGRIIIGFGILFSGLLNMTDAVSGLAESGIIERLFSSLGQNPLIGYLIGAGVAFVLQSSSATIGILQAFSTSGQLTFASIYAVLVGIYLGDCVTTAIVCNIGAKPDAKRVGIVNILFNLSKSIMILTVVTIIHRSGLLDGIWNSTIHSGGIANTNTIFNLLCAIFLLPAVKFYEKLSFRIVKDEPVAVGKYDELLDALNPVFVSTPALAFARCYDVLLVMYGMARTNINRAFELIDTILDYTHNAFEKRDLSAARHIEPLEEVVDDMVDVLNDNHLERLREGVCGVYAGTEFLNLLSEIERISDICSNVGVATVARVQPEMKHQVHEYVSMLHSGRDEAFNREYQEAHDRYFGLLKE